MGVIPIGLRGRGLLGSLTLFQVPVRIIIIANFEWPK